MKFPEFLNEELTRLILLAGSLMGCAETIRENIDKLFMGARSKPCCATISLLLSNDWESELLLSASTRAGSK